MQEKSTPNEKPNWALLAGLRFVLAVIVMAAHFDLPFENNPLGNISAFSGIAAVMIFFAISGTSIAHSITNEPRGYLKRRFWRIYPLFFVAMLASYVPWLLTDVVELPRMAPVMPSNLNFFLGFLPIHSVFIPLPQTNLPLWSLAVEEIFYLFAPLIVLLDTRRIAWLMVASAVAFVLLPFEMLGLVLHKPLLLLWAWLAGWLLYRARDNAFLMMLAIVVMCGAFSMVAELGGKFGVTLVGAGMLLLAYQDKVAIPQRFHKLCNYLGDLSFSLYVLHFPTLIVVYLLTKSTSPLLYLASVAVVSILALHLVDKPLRKRGRQSKTLTPNAASDSSAVTIASSEPLSVPM